MGNFGFSYVGLIFLIMLFVPNIIWGRNIPQWHGSKSENQILSFLEKLGQISVTFTVLCFKDFNVKISPRLILLCFAFLLMLIYEAWWIKYFKSEKSIEDFYAPFFKIPLPGAVLPVAAFLILGIYGKVIWLIIADIVFGIGHIGIHRQHKRNNK